MNLAFEETRAVVHAALAAVDAGAVNAPRLIAAAKVQAARAAHFVGGQGVQLHGGMGMTDELAAGHYYKRLMLCETQFGDADWWMDRLANKGINLEMQLKGQAAIVTGGASGIGAACAQTLAREGAKVMVTDIDDARGKDLVAEITKAGGTAAYLHQDVTDETAWPGIVGAAEKQFGGLHIMVANAGIGIMVPIWDMTLADWRRQQAINLDGVFLSVKYAIPAMRRSGGKGSIVMISSVAGLRGSPGLAAYSATKGGVRLFAKSVAMECAQAGDKIRVNSVHPGIIDTPIWGKIPGWSVRQPEQCSGRSARARHRRRADGSRR